MSQLINFMCSVITLFIFNSNISAQEPSPNEKTNISIEGKWEGNQHIY